MRVGKAKRLKRQRRLRNATQLCHVCKRELCPCSNPGCEKCHDMELAR